MDLVARDQAVRLGGLAQGQGAIWVNTYRAVSYMAPFGGYKRSGLGRESGQQAIHEYLQTKSVWLNVAEETPNPFVMG